MNRTQRGFTLAELVMAMAVVAIIGTAAAGVAIALSSAHEASEEYGESIQTARITMVRLRKDICSAKLVLQAAENKLVVWKKDTNGDQKINLSEVVRYYLDVANRQLIKETVEFPDSMADSVREALDSTVLLSTAISGTSYLSAGNSGYGKTTVIAEDVAYFRALPRTAPPLTKLLQIEVKVGDSIGSIRLRSAAYLRADLVKLVGESRGQYILTDGSGG